MSQPTPNPAGLPTDELLIQHVGWTRALAGRLVQDAGRADDLAQETLRIALERPPQDTTRLRSWLASVMRNLSREQHRSRDNQRAREETSARPEAQPATDELVQHLHNQRLLADSLLELDEPFRSALLLRFYEGLPPRTIARRLGVPVSTVKSRISRGLARLRESLDARYDGDRNAWLSALAPLLRLPEPALAVGFGGVLIQAKVAIAASLLLGAGGWALLSSRSPADERESADRAALSPSESGTHLGDQGLSPGSVTDFTTAAPRTPGAAQAAVGARPAAPAAAPAHWVRGRVLDDEGLPVAGLAVAMDETGEGAVTSSGGLFEFRSAATRGSLTVDDRDWVMIRTGSWSPAAGIEPVLVVARPIELGGRVVDGWGRELRGARVSLILPPAFSTRFDTALDATFVETWEVRTDDHGRFELSAAPRVSGTRLQAVHAGYLPSSRDVPSAGSTDLIVELCTPEVPLERALSGVVRRADGSPAERAQVALGATSVRTDRDGRFLLDLERAGEADALIAVEAGSSPARLTRPGLPRSGTLGPGASGWPEHVELQLGNAVLSIAGRLVDDAGQPLAGGRVWLAEPTPFGVVGRVPLMLEALMAGGQVPEEAIASIGSEEAHFGSAEPLQGPDAMLYYVTSDADGCFELGGLLDRAYRLNILAEDLSFGCVSEPVAAGSRNVQLKVGAAARHERIQGRVLTDRGDPVAGVTVTPFIAVCSAEQRAPVGSSQIMRFAMGRSAISDAAGRFLLRELPAEALQLHLISDGIVPTYAALNELTDPLQVDIVVLARVHLEVELAASSAADGMRIEDAGGATLPILEMRADGYSNHDSYPIRGGRSGVVSVTTNAARLLLLNGDSVLESIPLTPRPGETLRITR